MASLLFFEPVFKTMIWGGNRMRAAFGYDIPADNTGECWAISAHKNGDCTVAAGEYKGAKLSELWDKHRELFGDLSGDRFPLLLKVIDAKDDLSIQVHPDDDYAKVHENGSLGKTECWYILDCEPDSALVVGHNAKTREELCKLIDEHKFKELIREVPVKKGDFVQIDPGTVHAIKGGVMILETQQNSDITYRVYDYDRLQNGKPRDLHIEQSKAVIKVPGAGTAGDVMSTESVCASGTVTSTPLTAGLHNLVSCKYYTVNKLNVKGSFTLEPSEVFYMASCIEGTGLADGTPIKPGDHFIIPAGYGRLSFSGDMTLIISNPE